MQRIIALLKRYSTFLYFLVLQFLCFFFVVGNNDYPHAKFWNSSNAMVGWMNEVRTDVTDYFNLGDANDQLIKENARLKQELFGEDSLALEKWETHVDSNKLLRYDYLPTRVIRSSSNMKKNYLSIDIGTADGVKPNDLMGVVGPNGVVGYTKAGALTGYTQVIPILHANFILSVIHEKSGEKGSLEWKVDDDRFTATLSEVPRYADVFEGDTIVTSGNNGMFPRGEMIGTISEISEVTGTNFFNIKVKLATDFNKVYHVHVIRNNELLEFKALNQGLEQEIKDPG